MNFLVYFLVLLYVGYSSPPLIHVIRMYFSHDQSNRSSLSLSSITFQNSPGISDLLPEVPQFRHHTKLRSKYGTVAIPSLTEVQFDCEYSLLPVEICFCNDNPGFNFTCTSCIIRHRATQIFVTMIPKYLKYSTYSGCLLFSTICICDGCVGIALNWLCWDRS